MKKVLVLMLALLLMLSFVGCDGENNDVQEGESTTTSGQGASEPGTTESSGDNYTFDITEDDHTVIITIGNTIQVYTHDGVNVTGYTTYVDCGDAETAKAVASAIHIDDSYYAGMGLKSVTTKGSYVIQDYDETGFPCTTYEELQSLAALYKQIQQ